MHLRLILLLALLGATARAERWQHKSAPFTAVRWKGDTPIVRVDGAWYTAVALHGKPVEAILKFCREHYDRKWRKRFVEDLGQVFDEMKLPAARKVKLVLKSLGGETTEVEAEMSYRNRKMAYDAGSEQPFVVVQRNHGGADKRYAELAKRIRPDYREKTILSAEEAAADLDELEGVMTGAYSYLTRKKVDVKAALDTIRAGLGKKINRATFAMQVAKFLALFGDGHARVRASLGSMGGHETAPFLFGEEKGRIFLFKGDRTGFVHDADPFVKAIDGVPIEKWLAAAMVIVPDGSPQFRRRVARRNLRYTEYLRHELGVRHHRTLEVEFQNGDKEEFKFGDRARYDAWPRTRSGIVQGRIGYMRLPTMRGSTKALRWVEARMHEFKGTKGLIIDVRDNGGGTRDVLRVLAAYFMTEKDPPRVANVAAYRLPPWEGKEQKDGHLANRFLYPATWSGWSAAQKAVVQAHLKTFKPEWKPLKKGFTKWHVMLLDRSGAERPFVYREPVVILMNGGCFSATDIFLGALKGVEGVTLLGTPSGGGSGRARTWVLANSMLEIRLSSMASFRPDGRLYDGRGVAPDVVVEQESGNWIGRGDRQFEAALQKLK